MRDAGNTEKRRSLVTPYGVPCTMNPDQLLVQLRRLAADYRRGDGGRIEDLLATFAELDERLSASGQLPKEWKGITPGTDEKRKSGVHDCCNCCDYYGTKE